MTQEATPEIARKGKEVEAAMAELQRTLGVLSIMMGNNFSREQSDRYQGSSMIIKDHQGMSMRQAVEF